MEELTNEYAVDLLAFRLACLDGLAPSWWRPAAHRAERLAALAFPSTASEWRRSLAALDRLMNESFDYSELRSLATRMGASKRQAAGNAQVLVHMLKRAGADPGEADSALATMKVLRDLRRTLRHRANDPNRVFVTEQILHDFASYERHFRAMAAEVVKAFDLVVDYLVPLPGTGGSKATNTRQYSVKIEDPHVTLCARNAKMRTERDFLGNVEVPEDAYYGAHTARAMVNFPISGFAIGKLPELVKSLGFVKKAAALANHRLGDLTNEQAKYICNACDDLIAGRLHDHFPVDVYQGGAGTSTNMNANEVIANRALELWGYPLGSYDRIHPNNDVNLSQSTNDVYPTAVRLSILRCQATLEIALGELAAAFEERASSFGPIMKLGRTQLQDAVPMTLAQEFTAFASTIYEDVARLRGISAIMREINLGGTAIGTGINASREYQRIVVEELSKLTGIAFIAAADLIEACWDTGAFVLYSGMLKRTATKLSKICNDLRLLSSGPRGGLNEINLPSMQPGSSIMPGKVNPVIPEVVNQIAFQVIGHDLTVTMASEAGQLQLNAMEPVITFCVLQSLQLLTSACDVLRNKCVSGITANAKNCTVHLEVSTAVATALTPSIGYERAASIAKEVLHSGRNIRDVIAERDDISEDIKLMVADARAFTEPASRGH